MASYDDTATVSGSVVSIENGADDVPTKSLVVTIPASLSGVSVLNEKQTGRNLVALNASPQQAKRDYGITVNTQTADALNITSTGVAYACERLFYSFKKGTYAIKFLATSSDSYIPTISIYRTNGTGVKYSIQPNTLTTFTLSEDANIDIRLFASGSGDTTIRTVEYTNLQIEVGSTVSTYEPYNPTTYTANLGRTIYGGTADIVNGEGTDNTTRIQIKDRTWTITEVGTSFKVFTCNKIATKELNFNFQVEGYVNAETYRNYLQDKQCGTYNTTNAMDRIVVRDDSYATVEDFLTAVGDNYIVFENTTPTDFTFDGKEINTRLGYNAFWSEQGNTELTYYKSGYGFTSVTVNKTGRNLLPDTNYKLSNFSVADDGTVSQITTSAPYAWSYANSIFKTTLPAGTYTAIEELLTDSTNASHGVQVFNSSNNMIGRVSSGAKTAGTYSATFTLTQATDIGIVCKLYDGTAKLYIVSGSTVHAYEPYESVTKTAKLHKVIYGGLVDVIQGTAEPKNLADGNMRQDGNKRVILAENLYLKSDTYTISLDIETPRNFYYKKHDGGSWTNLGGYNKKVVTFTISEDDNYDFSYYVSTGVLVSEISNLMIELGSTASDYVPHFEPFTFPPISMSTDEGENTLFANEGTSAITYRKAVD